MFARIKKSGPYQYLQIVQNYRDGYKTKQRVIGTLGRVEDLAETNDIDSLVRTLSRYSDQVLLVLTSKSQISTQTLSIGPGLVFDRLWHELGIPGIITSLTQHRKFAFDIERAVFLTVLHRLFASGSDRSCESWKQDFVIEGADQVALHQMYRAMGFLGEEIEDQRGRTPFSPRCTKDVIEEKLFTNRADLFSELDLVFFDTTSIYFEGLGGDTLGYLGYSKDHRPDLNQMIVGAVLNGQGDPICCELWPGYTADVSTLLPVTDRIKKRFGVNQFCIVADRGMISEKTIEGLEQRKMLYILGVRMRKQKLIRQEILSRAGRYEIVRTEGKSTHDSSPLEVKEVWHDNTRYIVCYNDKQARKDVADRQMIIEALEEKLKESPKSLIGNNGFKKYLTVSRGSIRIDLKKIEEEARYDGKWVLQTNTKLSSSEVALKYKELWLVEKAFRDIKSILETRPIYHKVDETIRGHVFCSFLALVLRKELDKRLEKVIKDYEWENIKNDLIALKQIYIQENNSSVVIRTESRGICSDIFKAIGMALPPTVKRLS
jgi:transposase